MVDFIQAKTKLNVGPIHWPPFLSTRQLGFIVIATLVWIPFAIKKIVKGETLLYDPKLWLAGSVFVYFFGFLFGSGFRERDVGGAGFDWVGWFVGIAGFVVVVGLIGDRF